MQCAGGTRLPPRGWTRPEEDWKLSEDPVVGGSPEGSPVDGPAAGAPVRDSLTGTHPALPVMDDAARSRDAAVCPFLRGDEDGRLVAPAHRPRESQTCVAIGAPRPQSTSQQALVCLRATHVDCPRYQRGALVPPQASARATPKVPRATLAALLILVLSAGVSFGYVVQRGGLDIPAAGVTATEEPIAGIETTLPGDTGAPATGEPETDGPAGVASATPEASVGVVASAEPTPAPEVTSEPTQEHTAEPTPEPTAEPTPEPTAKPTPKPTARPTAKPTPKPSATPRSDRYKLLKACPDKKGCWIYTVRSGDNLFSIAKYFGHSIGTIYAWNPQYPGTRLKAGAQIRMPPPTR